MKKSYIQDSLVILLLVVFGVITRTVLHLAPNIEFVTGLSVISVWILKHKRIAIFVPLGIMILSDAFIGNTLIFLFTWSGFLFAPLLANIFHRKGKVSYIRVMAPGLLSVLLFYLWTNLGVVLLTGMYTKDLSGLLSSYYNALPFLRNQVLGNIIVISIFFAICYNAIELTYNRRRHEISS